MTRGRRVTTTFRKVEVGDRFDNHFYAGAVVTSPPSESYGGLVSFSMQGNDWGAIAKVPGDKKVVVYRREETPDVTGRVSIPDLRRRANQHFPLPGVTPNELDALLDAADALRRLSSLEGFVGALDLRHSSRDAIGEELMARGEYAKDAIARFDFGDDT